MTMTHASLFSGIGGFDLAAEWAGWTNSFNCEIDPFCRRILKYHFPNAEQYADIRTTDFTIWRGRVDVLTGGFPCQPFSLSGKRKGTEDDRYLWPEMLRVIRTVRPRWIVGENVFGIVNWSEGVVFEQVCSDLEAAGYAVQPYIIPACGGCYSYCLGCLDVYRRIVIIPPYPGAYYYTCFETEAYNHEDDPDYLKRRIPFWGWISCIPNRKVKHKKTNL